MEDETNGVATRDRRRFAKHAGIAAVAAGATLVTQVKPAAAAESEIALDELTDVAVAEPESGDLLSYTGSGWTNVAPDPLALRTHTCFVMLAGDTPHDGSASTVEVRSFYDGAHTFTLDVGDLVGKQVLVKTGLVYVVTETGPWTEVELYGGTHVHSLLSNFVSVMFNSAGPGGGTDPDQLATFSQGLFQSASDTTLGLGAANYTGVLQEMKTYAAEFPNKLASMSNAMAIVDRLVPTHRVWVTVANETPTDGSAATIELRSYWDGVQTFTVDLEDLVGKEVLVKSGLVYLVTASGPWTPVDLYGGTKVCSVVTGADATMLNTAGPNGSTDTAELATFSQAVFVGAGDVMVGTGAPTFNGILQPITVYEFPTTAASLHNALNLIDQSRFTADRALTGNDEVDAHFDVVSADTSSFGAVTCDLSPLTEVGREVTFYNTGLVAGDDFTLLGTVSGVADPVIAPGDSMTVYVGAEGLRKKM